MGERVREIISEQAQFVDVKVIGESEDAEWFVEPSRVDERPVEMGELFDAVRSWAAASPARRRTLGETRETGEPHRCA